MEPSLLRFEEEIGGIPTYLEAERFVVTALNAISAHIAILDEAGQILEVNAAWRQFAEINGFQDTAHGVGANYFDVCERATNPEAKVVADGLRDVLSSRQTEFYLEYPCHSPTERRWYVVRITRFDWYGHVRLIVAHQNITELKKVQIQLQESHARLEAIVNNVVDGIVTVDRSGGILSTNQAMTTIFGYTLEEFIGCNINMLVAEPYRHTDSDQVSGFTVKNMVGHEIEGRRKDGAVFPMYIAMSRMHMENQIIYTGVVQDITARKQLESEQLEKERLAIALEKEREMRQLKNRFISMMSHELKTPLASIRLASDFLKKYSDRATPEEKAESIQAIESQVQYLSEIVDDVTTLSKTEFIGEELNLETYDLETYLRDILEELEWVHHKTHRLVYKGVDRRVEAQFDRKLLRRAIVNLLSNAIKYSPEGGEVGVRLSVKDRAATIQITDCGIGIPPEDLPRLFEAFHRAENVGKLPGTGLGLAIARQSVELHGGTIAVKSKVGVGSTFTITLPLVIRQG
ncbi:MAG: PAS domain-containing sensor histidine kinase [Anaerolineae bacterium]|nr:PAS domain-containing sensor histidine kinase [Anaerolineae bacterium]